MSRRDGGPESGELLRLEHAIPLELRDVGLQSSQPLGILPGIGHGLHALFQGPGFLDGPLDGPQAAAGCGVLQPGDLGSLDIQPSVGIADALLVDVALVAGLVLRDEAGRHVRGGRPRTTACR
jgi:hypothetical protein